MCVTSCFPVACTVCAPAELPSEAGVQVVTGQDNGQTWDAKAGVMVPDGGGSAPVRQLPGGIELLPLP